MKNMNHLVSLLQEGYTTVGVVFGNVFDGQATSRVYTYKSHVECIEGDLVIVPPSVNTKLPSIATVVRVDDEPDLNFESGIEYKWLIARVDTSAYDKIVENEKKMVKVLRDGERAKQRRALLDAYQLELPADGEARKIFDQARQIGMTPKE